MEDLDTLVNFKMTKKTLKTTIGVAILSTMLTGLAGYTVGFFCGKSSGESSERQRIKNDVTKIFNIGDKNKTFNSLKEVGTRKYFLREGKINGYVTFYPESTLTNIIDGTFSENGLRSSGYMIDEENVPEYVDKQLRKNAE